MLNKFKEYFTYSSTERNGLIVLLGLIVFIVGSKIVFSDLQNSNERYDELDLESMLVPLKKDSNVQQTWFAKDLEVFDPNKLDIYGWKEMGFTLKQAASIINYKSKIGRFNKPEDLLKLYVMNEVKYNRIKDFIRIDKIKIKKPSIQLLDLNNCDSIGLLGLPGIGEYRVRKILKFRNALGGFYSIKQLSETYGLNSETYQKIKDLVIINKGSWKLLDINKDSEQRLESHAYISSKVAESIVFIRETVGSFLLNEDLVSMDLISANLYVKLQPYLRPIK